MPGLDEIRVSLDARIEQLENEILALRAARAALEDGTAEAERVSRTGASGRVRDWSSGTGACIGVVPRAVLGAFERWEERGRPAQPPAGWQRDRWLAAMPGYVPLLRELPDVMDRSCVRQAVLSRPMTADGMFEAMVIVYAWGWATTPVGVPRAQRTLSFGVERLGSALLASREAMLTRGPLAGYAALAGPHRVPGLGPSFGSKFLYFASPDGGRALILDEVVASWLTREAALTLSVGLWSRTTYSTYMTSMHAWASRVGIADHLLEELLFTEEATRRGLPAWATAIRGR